MQVSAPNPSRGIALCCRRATKPRIRLIAFVPIGFPPRSPVKDRNQPDRIKGSEPPGSL